MVSARQLPGHAWELIRQTADEWMQDKVWRLASSLAWFTVFSIAPLLVLVVAVAGSVLGRGEVREHVRDEISQMWGPGAASTVDEIVVNMRSHHGGDGLPMLLGILLLVYGATNVFAALQDALNTVWEVRRRRDLGWWSVVRVRLLSFAMVMAVAFLLLVSLVVSAVLGLLQEFLGARTGVPWKTLNFGASMIVFTLLFAMVFKYLPDVRIRWRDVWVGAAMTSLLFAAGKFLMAFYLGQSRVASVYGAAGSLVILLLWVYFSCHVVILGAEFTQVWARRYGRRIEPSEHAEEMPERQREKEGMAHKGQKPDLTPKAKSQT